MTIAKGQPWGSNAALPLGSPVVGCDRELRALIESRHGLMADPVGLVGGDLCHSVGGVGDRVRLSTIEATTLTCDVVKATLDSTVHWFVAHLVARRSWWRGPLLAAMNAEFIGGWDMAPRSHPNDGLVDVLETSMSVRERAKAWRRLGLGTHVPHPMIVQSRVTNFDRRFERPIAVWLDGDRIGKFVHIEVSIRADALTIVV